MRVAACVAAVFALTLAVNASHAYIPPDRTELVAWSPDSRWIAYNLVTQEGYEVRVVRSNGSGDRILVQAADSYLTFKWSPDSQRLAVTNGRQTWIAGVTGRPRRVGAVFGDWSRDGRRFVVVRREPAPTIYVVVTRTLGARRLVAGQHPNWSPTDASIAFSGGAYGACGRSRIYVVPVDGGRPRQVGPDVGERVFAREVGDQVRPVWSPGGRRIAWVETFRRGAPDGCARWFFPEPAEFSFARTRSGGQVGFLGEGWPDWSPTGKLLALGQTFGYDLTIVSPAGARLAFRHPVGGFDWSPKGRFIVVSSENGGRLYVARPDLTGETSIDRGRAPDWAPNGAWIAYVSDDDCSSRSSVYVARPDGSGERPITPC